MAKVLLAIWDIFIWACSPIRQFSYVSCPAHVIVPCNEGIVFGSKNCAECERYCKKALKLGKCIQ